MPKNPTTERQRLLAQLEKLDQQEEKERHEHESLIGRVILTAVEESRLSQEALDEFLSNVVVRKSDARKLNLQGSPDVGSTEDDDLLEEDKDEQEEEVLTTTS